MKTLQTTTLLQGGKYKILGVLGQGGFGITYLAIQSGLERKVAIKEFFMKELCERDESTSHVTFGASGSAEIVKRFREKFLKEARNIAKLNHPNIVRIIDVFEENGTAYYVMEYAENGSLADKVKREGYLTEPVATRYILQVASALDYIHQRKLNHLDVKPANIMINEKDECVLIDFGLSKQYDAVTGSQTSTTPVGISEGYAPMEQYKQGGVKEFSPETDIYALGATFFKLLTGTTPPSASDVNEDGVPIDELKTKGVSQQTIDVICKAMEGRKKDRMKDVLGFQQVSSAPTVNSTDAIQPVSIEETMLLHDKNESREERIQRIAMEKFQKELAEKRAEEERIAEQKAIEEELDRLRNQRNKEEELETEFNIKGVRFNMIVVEGGTYEMKETVSGGFLGLSTKEIINKTTLSTYRIGETQVTQALWKVVMGSNPSCFKGDNNPVENISWNDCQEFITKLNAMTGKNFRLPTEAEWEFAARGGNKSQGYEYSGSNDLELVAWYSSNSNNKTHHVGTKQPNELGIYDMSGNVWEWCNDWYKIYDGNEQTNPSGPDSGSLRVIRGGSWISYSLRCVSKHRHRISPVTMNRDCGLRLALPK